MKYAIKSASPLEHPCDCLIFGIFEDGSFALTETKMDNLCESYLKKLHKKGDIPTDLAKTTLLHHVPGMKADRILIMGLGKAKELTVKKFTCALSSALKALMDTPVKDAAIVLAEGKKDTLDAAQMISLAVMKIEEACYRLDDYRGQKKNSPPALSSVQFLLEKVTAEHKKALAHGEGIANGMNTAKDLGNAPANICTPSYIAKYAKTLAEQHSKLSCKVLDEADMEKLGMGGFMAISQGSRENGKMIILQYKGGKPKQKPVTFVGKGITFDTGGISIKPAGQMHEMKYDMAGAAAVIGTLQAAAELQLPINIVGIVVTAENMPSGKAIKPGDIVKTLSGITVEILNTDAEGRMILCDALTYAKNFDPEVVIDMATLTGAMVVSLGTQVGGFFSNDKHLTQDIEKASERALDAFWEMPLVEEYEDDLKSKFADITNVGPTRWGGAIEAALFLGRFTTEYRWAHLDIAGIAYVGGQQAYSTGRPVPMLVNYLLNQCEK